MRFRLQLRSVRAVAGLTVAALAAPTAAAAPEAGCGPVVTIGTSLETGALDPWPAWPQRLDMRLGGGHVTDRSLGGGSYTHDIDGDNIRRHVDAVIADCPPAVMYLGGPDNDLVSLNLDQIGQLNWAVHYADEAATAAGWRVLGGAVLPFTDGGAFPAGWWPTLEQRRQAYNSWGAAHFGDRWVDSSWALRETTTARGDARWLRDGLHLTRPGAALIAEVFPLDKLE